MALPAITLPLASKKKWIWQAAGYALGIWEGLLDEASPFPTDGQWRRFTMEYTRATPAGTVEDKAQIGFDIVNVSGGGFDSSWTPADHTTVHNALFAFDAAWKPLRSTSVSLSAIKAYPRMFADPMLPAKRFADGGPPTWFSLQNVPGTSATAPLPYQVACSVTLKTGIPRHWGRVYLPGFTQAAASTLGRWDTADMQTVEAAAAGLMQTLWDADFPLVVASTQAQSILVGNLLGVHEIQVDDIPDVIRRRRPRQAAVREVTPLA